MGRLLRIVLALSAALLAILAGAGIAVLVTHTYRLAEAPAIVTAISAAGSWALFRIARTQWSGGGPTSSKSPFFALLLVALAAVSAIGVRHTIGKLKEQRRTTAENTVVVRVFRDSKAPFRPELDRKLWEFNDQKHRTESGKYILAATIETLDYQKDLGEKVGQVQPQIVVLDSAADGALLPELGDSITSAKNVCTVKQECLALIPKWVRGNELTGARTLLDWLSAQ